MNYPVPYMELIRSELLNLGQHIRDVWRGEVSVSLKSDNSFITSADMHVHEALLKYLPQIDAVPVLSEEVPFDYVPDECWIIDPIDGTGAFVAGIPTWSISIVRISKGQPSFSCIYFPAFDWLLHSEMSGEMLKVHPDKNLIEREDFVTVPSDFHQNYNTDFNGKLRSLGSCSSEAAYAVIGASLCAFIGQVKIWDIAPAVPLIKRAGGVIRSVDAELFSIKSMQNSPNALSPPLLVGNPVLIERFVKGLTSRSVGNSR